MKSFLYFLSFFISVQAFSRSGGIVRNGADDLIKAQAWFLGDKPITGCVVRSEDYFASADELQFLVKSTFSRWQKYVEVKQLRQVWPKGTPFLNFNLRLNSVCKGNEDIRFLFGVQTEEVKKIAQLYLNPTGFNHLESYDSEMGRGKGFIWIQNLSSKTNSIWPMEAQLTALFFHEIGHVYGCDHVGGTIMREDVAQFLESARFPEISAREAAKFPRDIDFEKELFFTFERGVEAQVFLRPDQLNDTIKDFTNLVLGQKANGPLMMKFQQGAGEDSDLADLTIIGRTSLAKTEEGFPVFRMQFDLGSMISFSTADNKVFRAIYKGQESSFEVPGFIVQGKLLLDSSQSIPVAFARNRGKGEYVTLKFGEKEKGLRDFFNATISDQGQY